MRANSSLLSLCTECYYVLRMLLVKTKVGPSQIEGLGLFADEFIAKGTAYWEFEPTFDQTKTAEEIAALPTLAREYWEHFAYESAHTGRYILCGDNCRFMNHAEDANIIETEERKNSEEVNRAARDIQPGEELTVNYFKFGDPVTFVPRVAGA